MGALGNDTNQLKVQDLLISDNEIHCLSELQTAPNWRALRSGTNHLKIQDILTQSIDSQCLKDLQTAPNWRALGNDTKHLKLQEILTGSTEFQCLSELQYQGNWKAQRLFTESLTYQMLLRGRAKESEPFRKWVTEEMIPTIRKTGHYDMVEHMDSETLSVRPVVAHYMYNNGDIPQNSLSDLSQCQPL